MKQTCFFFLFAVQLFRKQAKTRQSIPENKDDDHDDNDGTVATKPAGPALVPLLNARTQPIFRGISPDVRAVLLRFKTFGLFVTSRHCSFEEGNESPRTLTLRTADLHRAAESYRARQTRASTSYICYRFQGWSLNAFADFNFSSDLGRLCCETCFYHLLKLPDILNVPSKCDHFGNYK